MDEYEERSLYLALDRDMFMLTLFAPRYAGGVKNCSSDDNRPPMTLDQASKSLVNVCCRNKG